MELAERRQRILTRCEEQVQGEGQRAGALPPPEGQKSHDDEEANKQGLVKGDRGPIRLQVEATLSKTRVTQAILDLGLLQAWEDLHRRPLPRSPPRKTLNSLELQVGAQSSSDSQLWDLTLCNDIFAS